MIEDWKFKMKLLTNMVIGFAMLIGNTWAVDPCNALEQLQKEYGIAFQGCNPVGAKEACFSSVDGEPGKAFGTNILVSRYCIHSRWYTVPSHTQKSFLDKLPKHLRRVEFSELRLDTLREMGEFVTWIKVSEEAIFGGLIQHTYKIKFCIWDKPDLTAVENFSATLPAHYLELIRLWLKWLGARKVDSLVAL